MVEAGADPENLCKKNGMKSGDQAVVLIHGLRIPTHSGHPFRFIPDSDSNPFRTPIPIHFGHPFQSNPDSSFCLFGLSDLEASQASGSSIFETLDN